MRNMLLAGALLLAVAACSANQTSGSTTTSSVSPDASAATAGAQSASVASTGDGNFGGANLPPGRELSDLQSSCEICHSGDMWYTQRLSKPVWDAEVTKMMKWGSPLPKADKARVVAYLAKYLGPTVPRRPAPPTATAPPISYSGPPGQ